MTELGSTDYVNKRIHLHQDTMTSGVSIVLYREIYAEKITTAAKQTWDYLACDAEGFAPKTATKKTARRLLLPTGWKIVPYDSSHTLLLLIEIVNIADSLENIGCFDRSGLAAGTDVDIDTTGIDKVEVITIDTGGGGYTTSDRTRDEGAASNASAAATDAALARKLVQNRSRINLTDSKQEVYNDADDAVEFEAPVWANEDGDEAYTGAEGQDVVRRDRFVAPP